MKFILDPDKRAFLRDLETEAVDRGMQVDYETLTLIPLDGVPKSWPERDNDPASPEQAGWDDIED